jgi:hypothetical protein
MAKRDCFSDDYFTEMSEDSVPPNSDGYDDLTALDWWEYQMATVGYDWQLDPRLIKTLESMAQNLYRDAKREGLEQGNYFEGLQEGIKIGKLQP